MKNLRSRLGKRPTKWATERATRIAEILVGERAHEKSSQPLIERVANLLDADRVLARRGRSIIPEEMALIVSEAGNEVQLIMPSNMGLDQEMTRMQTFVGAILLRAKDAAFVDEIIADFQRTGMTTH